jgi:hypothetical protein
MLFTVVLRVPAQEVAEVNRRGERPVKQQLVAAGTWQSRRNGGDDRGWHIQLKRLDDDSLTGRITVVGSPLIQQAKIEGQISGSDVYGVIVGDDDIQVATFTGSLFKGGMSGMYTTTDGDTGNWSWDGPPPADRAELDDPSVYAEPSGD